MLLTQSEGLVPATSKSCCAHCGQSLAFTKADSATATGNQVPQFCCSGCESVYTILHESGLSAYYQTAANPGTSQKEKFQENDYSYLDAPDVSEKFIEFKTDTKSRVYFNLPDIHCAACVWLLEKLPQLNSSILHSRVNYLKKELLLDLSPKAKLSEVTSLLAKVGYPPDLNLHDLEKKRSLPERGLLLRLGMAGFSFGNIMLFSMPEYLAMNLDKTFSYTFTTLNIILSLPVLFYSAGIFFKNAFKGISQRRINMDIPIVLGIIAMYARSIHEIASGKGPGYLDTFAGLIFFLLIGRFLQSKTFLSLKFDRDYRSFFPLASTLITEQKIEKRVPVNTLKEGDTIRCRNGEIVPADAQLLSDRVLLDYSYVTGEAEPVEKKRDEEILAGGKVKGNSALFTLKKNVSQSYLTRLWNSVQSAKAEKEDYSSLAMRLSPVFTWTILAIAAVSGIFWSITDSSLALNAITGVLIIACPCALAMATPFTLGSTLNFLSRNGLYLKNASVIERFFSARNLVFDKTGTLTSSEEYNIEFSGAELSKSEIQSLASVFSESTHPLSLAIVKWLLNKAPETVVLHQKTEFHEIAGKGFVAKAGKSEIFAGSKDFLVENLSKAAHQVKQIEVPEFASTVYIAMTQEYRGVFILSSTFRPGLEKTMAELRGQYNLALLSGDNDREKKRLSQYFLPGESLVFNARPDDKVQFIQNQSQQGSCIMLGDGINDAGALAAASVGIAVSENIGTFTPQSDGILHADKIPHTHRLFSFARSARSTIIASFAISFIYNIVGLTYAVQGKISPLFCAIIMPLSSLTVIGFSLSTTWVKARLRGLT